MSQFGRVMQGWNSKWGQKNKDVEKEQGQLSKKISGDTIKCNCVFVYSFKVRTAM